MPRAPSPTFAGSDRLEVRIRPEERARIVEAAARSTGPDGRPLSLSAWARVALLDAARKAKRTR